MDPSDRNEARNPPSLSDPGRVEDIVEAGLVGESVLQVGHRVAVTEVALELLFRQVRMRIQIVFDLFVQVPVPMLQARVWIDGAVRRKWCAILLRPVGSVSVEVILPELRELEGRGRLILPFAEPRRNGLAITPDPLFEFPRGKHVGGVLALQV